MQGHHAPTSPFSSPTLISHLHRSQQFYKHLQAPFDTMLSPHVTSRRPLPALNRAAPPHPCTSPTCHANLRLVPMLHHLQLQALSLPATTTSIYVIAETPLKQHLYECHQAPPYATISNTKAPCSMPSSNAATQTTTDAIKTP